MNSVHKLELFEPLLKGSLQREQNQQFQMRAELWSEQQHVGQPLADPE